MAHPKAKEALQAYLDQKPFAGFKIADNSVLSQLNGRHPCPICGKSRKMFCYTCYVPISTLKDQLPHVKLPVKIDIIKHKHEIDGKSTAAHAAILAPDDVRVYTYPDIPNYEQENAVLIFPSQNSVSIAELVQSSYAKLLEIVKSSSLADFRKGFNPGTLKTTALKSKSKSESIKLQPTNELPITKVIFIDSTWNQCRGIYKDERIKNLPCVMIQNRISQFWRHQKGSPRWYLATIEAIHQFLVEVHLNLWGLNKNYEGIRNCFNDLNCLSEFYKSGNQAYNGEYDNLLFFFQHMYELIHNYYSHDNLHAYKRRLQ